ncbi:binding-protein-dependent transport systems inner membrane component [Neobacillus bataviensis LMG 21833]|uniref:Binding-protein-dependent transport systems inner membrane component n=1 Tax=Neobacillus bataviensis LMG 21833 TaxID=1117379 RepID=K6DAB1_9BACI|nr:ABC transporter permease subunit [Neobacillus bataviensis]EKN65264.1 binding-protein-dependent transport systems inner membrane component [Neobacillus bataviensis LMG 21833]
MKTEVMNQQRLKTAAIEKEVVSKRSNWKKIKKHWQLYFLVAIPLVFLIIFKYIPMAGIVIAFKDYSVVKGIAGSDWVGLKYFKDFFLSPNFSLLLKNTLGLSVYGLLVGFICPIILALALNEVQNARFKKIVQTVTYAPYFISTVIMVSIIILFLSPSAGFINNILGLFGMEPINFLGNPSYFKSIYVWSDVWQNTGYATIIYLAALAGVDTQLYEAAKVDGANRFQKIMNVDLPGIFPIIIVLLILNVGSIMSLGFEKIYLLQNPLNTNSSEVISTYVYKVGLLGANFSFASAVGLFNSIVNFILIFTANTISKRFSSSSLW